MSTASAVHSIQRSLYKASTLPRYAPRVRFTYEHTGFTGVGGFFMARLLGRIRRKMLGVGLPAVLADLDDHGAPHTTR